MSFGSHKMTRRGAVLALSSGVVVPAVVLATRHAHANQTDRDIHEIQSTQPDRTASVPGFSFPAPSDVGLYLQQVSEL